jgi:hypothetical protein
MVLRRPVKYNPDKRDFVLTESALSTFEKAQKQTKTIKDDIYETASEVSRSESNISYGNRVSQFGFTDMFGQQKAKPAPQKQQY